jgi:hypothetical protein
MLQRMRTLAALSTGGIMLGVLQAFDMISFANAITRFLATFLSLIVTVLLGGDPNNLFLDGNLDANLPGDGTVTHH